jgi:hypothetical protein
MAIDVPLQAAPQAAPAAPQAAGGDTGMVDGIRGNEYFQQVKSGDIPALFASPDLFGERAGVVLPAIKSAADAEGLGYADAPKSGGFVVFNPSAVTAEAIAAADEAGTLGEIAAVLSAAEGAAAEETAATEEAAAAPAAAPTNVAAGLLPAGAEDDLMAARIGNLEPKPPVKQARPSQGIINGLLARAT